MTMLRTISLTVLLASALTLTACGGGGSAGGTDEKGSGTVNITPPDHQGGSEGGGTEPPDEISEMRMLWESQGLANYDFVLQRSSFSPPNLVEPVAMQVRGGKVTSRIYVNSGLPATGADPSWWPSIDGLFDFLEAARDGNADKIEVQYDARRGYPTQAFVDYVTGMADEERGFSITSFVPR